MRDKLIEHLRSSLENTFLFVCFVLFILFCLFDSFLLFLLFVRSCFRYLQDVLRCIGGMKIFLPLLEQISYFEPPKRSHGSDEQLQIFDIEKSSEERTGANYER